MEIDEDPHSSQDHIVHSTFPILWVVQYDGTSYAATAIAMSPMTEKLICVKSETAMIDQYILNLGFNIARRITW